MTVFKKISRRTWWWGAASFALVLGLGVLFYVAAQNLVERVVRAQLQQAGYRQAVVVDARLYLDGIVIGRIGLTPEIVLHDIFTPQSAPDIARNGLRHVIVKKWDQQVEQIAARTLLWPFPQLEDFSVEDMHLTVATPLGPVDLRGTMKSLRPAAGQLALILPFDAQEQTYTAQGKLEIGIERGRITTLDVNLEDGSYHSADDDVSLKRLSGWCNATLADGGSADIQAQFMAGSVHYDGMSYADGMVQYASGGAANGAAQWTVTLNRAADAYYNTWVIEPAPNSRYIVKTATQSGDANQQNVMVSGAPLRLEPLLPAP